MLKYSAALMKDTAANTNY